MNRRPLLATLAAALAGCGGYADAGDDGDGGGSRSSEGDDDEPIDAPAEDLLLSADALGDDWERRETDDEHCQEFSRDRSGGDGLTVTSCAWVYEDTEQAQTEYDTRVERTHKLSDGSRTDDDPDVGVEAAAVRDGLVVEIVFRDANAVGYLEHRPVVDGPVSEGDVPPRGDAFDRAAVMHQEWRD